MQYDELYIYFSMYICIYTYIHVMYMYQNKLCTVDPIMQFMSNIDIRSDVDIISAHRHPQMRRMSVNSSSATLYLSRI